MLGRGGDSVPIRTDRASGTHSRPEGRRGGAHSGTSRNPSRSNARPPAGARGSPAAVAKSYSRCQTAKRDANAPNGTRRLSRRTMTAGFRVSTLFREDPRCASGPAKPNAPYPKSGRTSPVGRPVLSGRAATARKPRRRPGLPEGERGPTPGRGSTPTRIPDPAWPRFLRFRSLPGFTRLPIYMEPCQPPAAGARIRPPQAAPLRPGRRWRL